MHAKMNGTIWSRLMTIAVAIMVTLSMSLGVASASGDDGVIETPAITAAPTPTAEPTDDSVAEVPEVEATEVNSAAKGEKPEPTKTVTTPAPETETKTKELVVEGEWGAYSADCEVGEWVKTRTVNTFLVTYQKKDGQWVEIDRVLKDSATKTHTKAMSESEKAQNCATPTPTSTPTPTKAPEVPTLGQQCVEGGVLISNPAHVWTVAVTIFDEGGDELEYVYLQSKGDSESSYLVTDGASLEAYWIYGSEGDGISVFSDLIGCNEPTPTPIPPKPDPKSGNLVESSLVCRPEGGGTVTTTTTPWTQDWVLEDGKWVLGGVVYGDPVEESRDATEQECPVTKPTPTPTPTDPPTTGEPTDPPTSTPTPTPTDPPSGKPTDSPTSEPTKAPTTAPSGDPGSDKDKSDPKGPAKTGAIGDNSTDAILVGALATILMLALVAMRMGRRPGGKHAARS